MIENVGGGGLLLSTFAAEPEFEVGDLVVATMLPETSHADIVRDARVVRVEVHSLLHVDSHRYAIEFLDELSAIELVALRGSA